MRNRALIIAAAERSKVEAVRRAIPSHGFELAESDVESSFQQALSDNWRWLMIVSDGQTHPLADLIRKIRSATTAPVVVVAPTVDAECAITAFRAGASDVVAHESFSAEVDAMLARIGLGRGSPKASGPCLHGVSGPIARVRSMIDRAAQYEANVLITGETGTGKEVTASLIHRKSARHGFPFISINCAALPDGLLESELFGHERGAFTGAHAAHEGKLQAARGGTVFLDEIGDMSLLAQAKVLRAIESRHVMRLGGRHEIPINIRVIAATNQDLETMIAEKKFREDLYYRLNVARIHLPPLRERREDIPLLIGVVLEELASRRGKQAVEIESGLVDKLRAYAWPGNIRELRNLMESMFMFRSNPARIRVTDLPPYLSSRLLGAVMPKDEPRTRILEALTGADWNKSRAARILHCSRMTLYRKIAEYGITSKASA